MVKPILMIVSEVGYTWDEVILPYLEFEKAGYAVVIATPTGQLPNPDPYSIRVNPVGNLIGYGTSFRFRQTSKKGKTVMARLEKPIPLSGANAADYHALFIAGGHGGLFDLHTNADLHRLILEFDQDGKAIGALCHSSSVLAYARRDNQSFIQDKKVTGFPTALEHFILKAGMVHPNFRPLPIWTGRELDQHSRRRSLLLRMTEILNPFTTVRDRNLVTGVGPKASRKVAKLLLSSAAK